MVLVVNTLVIDKCVMLHTKKVAFFETLTFLHVMFCKSINY